MPQYRNDPHRESHSEVVRKLIAAIQKSRPSSISKAPDEQSRAEEQDLDAEQKVAELRGINQDIDERKKYAHRSFWLVTGWLIAIGIIFIFQGFRFYGFSLEPEVLLALIGGTTTGIVGIFLVVSRYLFPRR